MNERGGGGVHRSHRPIFNIPASVLATVLLLGLVHTGMSLLPWEQRLDLLLILAFIPARYGAGAAVLPGGSVTSVTSFATYMLVHGGTVHLLVNCLWMLAFGSAVAKCLGGQRFFAFSLFCGVAAAFAHLMFHFGEAVPVVGASGVISGHMAGAIRFVFGARGIGVGGQIDPARQTPATIRQVFMDRRILIFLAIWMVINAIFGLGGVSLDGSENGIAWEAHVGGFFAGLFSFGLFDSLARQRQESSVIH